MSVCQTIYSIFLLGVSIPVHTRHYRKCTSSHVHSYKLMLFIKKLFYHSVKRMYNTLFKVLHAHMHWVKISVNSDAMA